ncbi:cobalt ABC transporter substrate-binding protein [Bradyrhizobium sp. CCBAU 45321]|uniref:cobalt ABC transporter substrate-binding protein n=1 Tax=Bradyrhizobium sp. CCBAU 45321 TaxID=1641878 RepID=UPI002303AE45|nr:cobalt ABC transporter substrate-binding protein [Bradyrhizobium sp. CCBAU 45321]MDA9544361.1 cobalt ABC transporter substrate-binding protein [Bradyrhizobium sp. CCBAU 45321]
MIRSFAVVIALLAAVLPARAHQIWIEQADGQNAIVRFGEFGENLREVSPGLLDKLGKVTGTLISAKGEKGEQKSDATKSGDGFRLPFSAAAGDTIVAEDASYPLYVRKQPGKDVNNWFYPAARYITSFAAQQPKLVFDLVPTGQEGQFKLIFKDQPKAKTKVTLVTESGWQKDAHTDEQGHVTFDMPWKGVYVVEVSFNDHNGGERAGTNGTEKYDAVSYSTTVTFVNAKGLAPIPAGPPATPAK